MDILITIILAILIFILYLRIYFLIFFVTREYFPRVNKFLFPEITVESSIIEMNEKWEDYKSKVKGALKTIWTAK